MNIFDKGLELLEAHEISYRFNGVDPNFPELKDVQVLSEYINQVGYGANWVTCPDTLAGIYQFLGY